MSASPDFALNALAETARVLKAMAIVLQRERDEQLSFNSDPDFPSTSLDNQDVETIIANLKASSDNITGAAADMSKLLVEIGGGHG